MVEGRMSDGRVGRERAPRAPYYFAWSRLGGLLFQSIEAFNGQLKAKKEKRAI